MKLGILTQSLIVLVGCRPTTMAPGGPTALTTNDASTLDGSDGADASMGERCCRIERATTPNLAFVGSVCEFVPLEEKLLGRRVRLTGHIDSLYRTSLAASCGDGGRRTRVFFEEEHLQVCCSVRGDVVLEVTVRLPNESMQMACTDCGPVALDDVVVIE